jgi:hypothetical protein
MQQRRLRRNRVVRRYGETPLLYSVHVNGSPTKIIAIFVEVDKKVKLVTGIPPLTPPL